MLASKWFSVSVSLCLCGLVSKLAMAEPTVIELNHRGTEAQRRV